MIEADPKILEAAEKLFRTRGYYGVELADIATEANVALPAVQSHFPDKTTLLAALLDEYSPKRELRLAFSLLHSGTPEGVIRDTVERLVRIFEDHASFANLVVIDMQVNNGSYVSHMFSDLTSDAANFINRLSAMPGVRPVSSIMLARTLSSLVIGFIATQYLAPQNMQYSMRIYPQKAWIDGITQIILHGILE